MKKLVIVLCMFFTACSFFLTHPEIDKEILEIGEDVVEDVIKDVSQNYSIEGEKLWCVQSCADL